MTRRAQAIPVLVALALAITATGCGSDDDSDTSTGAAPATEAGAEPSTGAKGGANAPAPSGEAVRSAKVTIANYAYDPDPVRIQTGGKVIWQNEDSEAHTATAEDGSFDTGQIEEGKLKSETFKEPGTFAYVCTIHPQMHGTVEVVEKG